MSSERRYKVLTAVGRDRPGLVQRIASAIHAGGANLEDSRMAILGGEFALIVLFAGSADAVQKATDAAKKLEPELGLRMFLDDTAKGAPARYLAYHLRVSGVDHPGIVVTVSQVLANHGINVASLESRLQFAAESGTPIFVLKAELQVPSEGALDSLKKDLGAACDEGDLDLVLEAG